MRLSGVHISGFISVIDKSSQMDQRLGGSCVTIQIMHLEDSGSILLWPS